MRRIDYNELVELARQARGEINHIYLHWTAGHYSQFFDDYHINIDFNGALYISTEDFTEKLEHTWHRNSKAIGIALCCCVNGTTEDLGPNPPTEEQLYSLSKTVALLCKALDLEVTSDVVMTHAEAADLDDYGPATTCERWDLWFLRNGEEQGTGGDKIREVARAIQC